jgi:hypothetical protein
MHNSVSELHPLTTESPAPTLHPFATLTPASSCFGKAPHPSQTVGRVLLGLDDDVDVARELLEHAVLQEGGLVS